MNPVGVCFEKGGSTTMINRYASKEIGTIWEDTNKFRVFWEVEKAVALAFAQKGIFSEDVIESNISKDIEFDAKALERIAEHESALKHDVLAFIAFLQESIPSATFVLHTGMTSSDVVDSALAIMIRDSIDAVLVEAEELMKAIKSLAWVHIETPCIGRSHGIHAEPMAFGQKVCTWGASVKRSIERLKAARQNICYGKISGAVGTWAHLSPEIEEIALGALGLRPEPVSTQIIPRDRYTEVQVALGFLATAMEGIAQEIRHLSRTEVREVCEGFGKKQKGSSAMPHKRNPMNSENICGLARVVRGYMTPSFENISVWHERDISHSSVERIILPDSFHLVHTMCKRMAYILSNLEVYPANMMENLKKNSVSFSGSLLGECLKKGMSREECYLNIQGISFEAIREGKDFESLVRSDDFFPKDAVDAAFDLSRHLRNAPVAYSRVFGGE